MTAGGGSGSGSDRPGLSADSDDLLAELDAWDKTFDALHASDDSILGGAPAGAPPAAPTQPPVAPSAFAPSPSAPSPPAPAPAPAPSPSAFGPSAATIVAAPPAMAAPTPPPPELESLAPHLTAPAVPPGGPAPSVTPQGAPTPGPFDAVVPEGSFDGGEDDVTRTVPARVLEGEPRPARTTPPPAPRARASTTAPPPSTTREPAAPRAVVATVPRPPSSPPRPGTAQPTSRIARPVTPPPVAAPPPPALPSVVDETDFSDLGFSGPPAALGSLLGQPPPLPPLEDASEPSFDDDEVLTSAVRPGGVLGGGPGDDGEDPFAPGADATRVAQVSPELFDIDETMDRGAARRRGAPEELSDPGRDPSDDTFERANRTRILDPDEELLAEAGSGRAPEGPADKRPARTPAIVRRGQPAPDRARRESSGAFSMGESTRVADIRELERMARNPQQEPRTPIRETPAAAYQPPDAVGADEDFYADIEIGGDAADDEATGTPAASKRVTSNVVRRATEVGSGAVPRPRPVERSSGAIAARGDDDLELEITGAAPAASAPASTAARDELDLDAAIAEFGAPEVTPVGSLDEIAVTTPIRPSQPRVQPPAPPAAEANPFADGPTGTSVELEAIAPAVVDLRPEASRREVVGAPAAEPSFRPDDDELEVEVVASQPAEDEAAPAEVGADDVIGSLLADGEADAGMDELVSDLAIEESTSIETPPVAPAAPPPAPRSNPFGADQRTMIGVPPPPRARSEGEGEPAAAPAAPAGTRATPPGGVPIPTSTRATPSAGVPASTRATPPGGVPASTRPAPDAEVPHAPIAPIAGVAPVAAPNARTLIGALAPVTTPGAPPSFVLGDAAAPPTSAESRGIPLPPGIPGIPAPSGAPAYPASPSASGPAFGPAAATSPTAPTGAPTLLGAMVPPQVAALSQPPAMPSVTPSSVIPPAGPAGDRPPPRVTAPGTGIPAASPRPATPPLGAAIPPAPMAPPSPALPAAVFGDALPELDLDRLDLPEQVDPTGGFDPGELAARGILVLEQELSLIDDPAQQAVLRVEAGRLYERLGDADHARESYDAALLADPRATAALRGLRRIARGAGDLAEATTHLDAELGIAGPLERRALALHRVDLLMAASEQDLARVAVGELLDEAAGDVRAQLAQLELAFLDGRADELGEALEKLAVVTTDPSLRAALALARGHLAERANERRAADDFTAAIAADPGALAAHLGAMRVASPDAATAGALRGLAARTSDRPLQIALSLEAARRGDADALAAAAADGADDATVQAAVLGDAMTRGALTDAAIAIAPRAADPALRRAASLWASARLAPDDPRTDALLEAALDAEPGDDLAAATLADRLFAAGDPAGAAERLERRLAAGHGDELDRVRAATFWAAAGRLDAAQALVPATDDIASPAAAEIWADILGVAGRAGDRGALYAAVAARSDERVDGRLWASKAALALDRAATPDDPATLVRALDAWTQVADLGGDGGELAHARSMALAAGTGDRDVILRTWARAQGAAESTPAASTFALARARFATGGGADWSAVDELLHDVPADDPRRLAAALVLGAAAGRWGDVALALEDQAGALADRAPLSAALLRYRAAGIYLDRANDPARAAALLGALVDEHAHLGFVHDALAAARRRLGDAAPPPRPIRTDAGGDDAFARLVRDGEQLAAQGDAIGALSLLAKALELRPHDPLAAEPLQRLATGVREAGPITALALAELRLAEDGGDERAKADAYEALARIDLDLRDDRASALISLEAAAAADPGRTAVLRELERAYGLAGRWADLAALRERQLASAEAVAADAGGSAPTLEDRVALALDRASLLERLDRPEDELRAAYQAIVDLAPRARRALFHLETLVRRGGTTPELARLEDLIADYFEGDDRSVAAFLTRGGETLAELHQLDDAIARFRRANDLRGGYPAALEGWRDAALRGQRWADFAEAASKEAALSDDDAHKAELLHLAGVALMDRAQEGERAVDLLRAALTADPKHLDAFLRLRLLLDEQGEHEALAAALETRLDVETDTAERVALHRAIAELARNFLEDRERAKHHLRAIVERAPNDLRAIAALSDIAWEQGAWGDAADMLIARARLERDPRMLRNIHYRLGMIYAERLPDPPAAIRAFQRVLAHDPDDEEALERLADLGIATADWRMALGACERLVKNETVPARKVQHLHRVGRIFAEGFGDRRRAERAYQLAVDAAPDSDVALGALIKFYEDAGDAASIRVHLGMVAAAMRQRVAAGPEPGAFRVLARVARARHDAGVPGQAAVHRNAVDVARLLGGDAGEGLPPQAIQLAGLLRPEADELLWPAGLAPELRQIFTLLGDRLAKHVGIDLRPYGVTRGDRLRAKDSPVAAAAQEVAEAFGLGEIDVYVSQRQPFAMIAEPTSPLSLVLGSAIADPQRLGAVRFAAAGALRLAHAQLAILARLSEDDLGVLVVALLRLFQPDFPYLAVDSDQVIAQLQRLRRLIPSSLLNELRPYALGVHAASFDHRQLARALETAGHRAGLVAAGGAAAPLAVLVARAGAPDLASAARVPAVADLVQFSVSEDFAALAALCTP